MELHGSRLGERVGVVPTEASELWLGSLLLGLASQVRAQRPGREGSLRAEYI